ncbi:MAG TPA: SLC13 family permease [Terracidiphilus sp.]|nr:SLC13 family permease [Terracidiphilus sp.]
MSLAADYAHNYFLLACVAGTVLLILLLIARARLHPALALCVAALTLGVASGMPLAQVPLSFTGGVGNLLGHIAIVLGLGAILGRLLATSGGATALGNLFVDNCGPQGLPWALLGLGILVGLPVFFEVGLVLLLPIVAEVARRSHRPPILVALPVLAGLSIVHGTLPPHPAAMLAVTEFHADLGRTILWGLAAGLPAAALAGPGLGWFLMRRWERHRAKSEVAAAEEGTTLFTVTEEAKAANEAGKAGQTGVQETVTAEDAPQIEPVPKPAGPLRAAAAILLPVALIFLGSWAGLLTAPDSLASQILHFTGTAEVALLIGVLVALVTLGSHIQTGRHHGVELLRRLTGEAFEPIAGVLVILAAAGGLSGILRDSGASQATVGLALGAHIPPLVLAWLLAAVVRVSVGSSTVAMAVASGILAPLAGHAGVRPELLVLATGTGSLMLSHVNDPGFWMIQSFFKLELKETLSTWTVLETVLSVAGLGTTLLLSALLR